MAKARKRDISKDVTVRVRPGQEVIVKNTVTADDLSRPFWHRWADSCNKVPADVWPLSTKHHPKCRRLAAACACVERSIKIADMHTMQLVNSIKWCIRHAGRYLTNSPFSNLGLSRADLLATVPQWASLLVEAKKRNLNIIDFAPAEPGWISEDSYSQWFIDGMVAVGKKALIGK